MSNIINVVVDLIDLNLDQVNNTYYLNNQISTSEKNDLNVK